uniref:Uncharacterized protein n=1 Tax=viral metagenome TaxID=1070528 RepID=A0A6H1ZCR7_9ZZZZ
MRSIGLTCLFLALIVCVGCQTPALLGGRDSPGTEGGSSTAAGGQGAGTIAGDQGQAQTPQTGTTGTATVNAKFASEGVDPGIGKLLIDVAREKDWTPDQLAAVFKSMNGAPENVAITFGDHSAWTATTGGNEQIGSTGGTGGGGGAARDQPRND